jgi:hypothetical protein
LGAVPPPGETLNEALVHLGSWLIPLASVAAAVAWTLGHKRSGAARVGLWLRLGFATLIGLNGCLFLLIDAIEYDDSRNSGVLAVWMPGVLVGASTFALAALVRQLLPWRVPVAG